MRYAIFGLAMLLTPPALANEECNRFTSEMWEPGIRTAEFENDAKLTISDASVGKSEVQHYTLVSVGTGIPYRAATNVSDEDDVLAYRFHKNDLIIDMEVFEPACQ